MAQLDFDARYLFLSLITAIACYVLVAFLLQFVGLSDFDAKTVLVSVPTVIGVLFLIFFGFISSDEVSWSKQGFDFSVLAFGAVLSALTLQLFLKTPVLPRLAQGHLGLWIDQKLGAGHSMYVLLVFAAFFSSERAPTYPQYSPSSTIFRRGCACSARLPPSQCSPP